MRLRTLALVGGLLGMPLVVSAQTHPCDVTAPTTYQIRRDQSVRVAFCHTQQDDEGGPIALGQIRFRVVNASTQALIVDLGLLTPLTGPNAAGAYYFESSSRFFTADVNLLVSAEFNAVVVPSTPILVDVRGGPKAPISPRVVLQ
jgi:hypothetical protein